MTPNLMTSWLSIQGCSTHNLRSITLKIPLGKITMVTGPSGSGKASLVWHTLYSGSYLHYLESVSPFLRSRLERVTRPQVLALENLPPAVGDHFTERLAGKGWTICRAMDIEEPIAVLFDQLAVRLCPTCRRLLRKPSLDELVIEILNLGPGDLLIVCEYRGNRSRLKDLGFHRTVDQGVVRDLEEAADADPIPLLIDRLANTPGHRDRLYEALQQIRDLSGPEVVIWKGNRDIHFPVSLFCTHCRVEYRSETAPSAAPVPPECTLLMGKTRRDWLGMAIDVLLPVLNELAGQGGRVRVSEEVFRTICARLEFLRECGLGYLSLDRSLESLSWGERRRVNQAFLFGSSLSGTLIALDYPGAGIEAGEITRMASRIERLKKNGNTVIMVENRLELAPFADYIVELGPGSGAGGGQVCYAGDARSWIRDKNRTPERGADYRPVKPTAGRNRTRMMESVTIESLGENGSELQIAKSELTVLSGPIGSGKTRLLMELARNWPERVQPGEDSMPLELRLAEYLHIDRPIREFMAARLESRLLHFTPAHFSRKSTQGRCLECKGKGETEMDLHFLPPVRFLCPLCQGSGLSREIGKIKWRGRSISEMWESTIDSFLEDFGSEIPAVRKVLEIGQALGVGHLHIGQPLDRSSIGERRLVALSKQLSHDRGETVFLLDHPTFALQDKEVIQLLEVLGRLSRRGHTVIAADNHPLLTRAATWMIVLSPGSGRFGGGIFQGSPADWKKNKKSGQGLDKTKISY